MALVEVEINREANIIAKNVERRRYGNPLQEDENIEVKNLLSYFRGLLQSPLETHWGYFERTIAIHPGVPIDNWKYLWYGIMELNKGRTSD